MQAKEILGKKHYMLRLTAPIFIVYLMNMAVNTIDQIMVGNYSQAAVSAVGNANQISWVLTMFFTVLNTASVILITQFKGANNHQREKVIYVLSLLCNVIAAAVVGVVSVTMGRPIFTMMNVHMQGQQVMDGACSYLAITGGGVVFMSLVLTYSSFLRSNSQMTWPLVASFVVNIVNILGNWVLIFGVGPFPELGVTGAAISTTVSRMIGAILLAIVFRVKVGRLEWKQLRPFPFGELKRMLRIGLPSAGETISYNISQLVVMTIINAMGLVAVNTKIYASSVAAFAYVFAIAMAESTQVVVGYMVGDRQLDNASRRVKKSLIIAIAVAVGISAVLWLFSDTVVGIFMATSNDTDIAVLREQILALAGTILLIDILLEFGRVTNLIMVRALQTAGDVVFPVGCSIVSSWCISVALSYLLGVVCGMGLVGVWIAFCCDECIRGIALIIRWKRGHWRKIDLIADVREENAQSAETAKAVETAE